MILDTVHGHIEEIVCGKSGLTLNHEIRDMEEYDMEEYFEIWKNMLRN